MDRDMTGEGQVLAPWLIRQEAQEGSRDVIRPFKQEKLIQCINFNHFLEHNLFVFLRHASYEEGIIIKASPMPYTGELLTCHWERPLDAFELDDYYISSLLVTFGDAIIAVEAETIEITPLAMTVRLGKACHYGRRQGQRHSGLGVGAEFTQHAFLTKGDLVDFGGGSFLVRVNLEDSSSVRGLNREENVTLRLFSREKLVFSGECRLVRQNRDRLACYVVFLSIKESISRLPAQKIRNPRKEINPPPLVNFIHPLTGKKIFREISDISTSGFSLQEPQKEETLFPGLIILQVSISHGGFTKMKCAAQVIFRRKQNDRIIFGLTILDMDIRAFSVLSHIISNNTDPRACVSTELDMEELWKFLFETDFIYPEKYQLLQGNRETLRETFRRVYQDNIELSRHFTYEKNGAISAHIAMLWAYDKAWMIHHFAARTMESTLTGFLVLKQLLVFINGFHRLPSANMDYALTYYRPTNRIIKRVFGGFTDHINDLRACSQDLFSYFNFTPEERGRLAPPWTIRESTHADMRVLERFYNKISGGMLLDALSFRNGGGQNFSLEAAYREAGFIRKSSMITLCCKEKPVALLMVNHSEPGLNLSELLNCIKVVVIEPKLMPWDILSQAIAEVSVNHPLSCPPVMIYPASYAETEGVPHGKQYQLWILNTAYGGPFLEYLERKFRLRIT